MPEELDRLVEALAPGRPRARGAHVAELGLGVAGSQAERESPAGDQVQGGRLLRHHKRIAHAKHDDRRAQPDPLRSRSQVAEEHHGLEHPWIAILEVGADQHMVERPDSRKPELFRRVGDLRDLLDRDPAMSVWQRDVKVHLGYLQPKP